MTAKGFFNQFTDVWILDGVRTPMVDYQGALAEVSPTDLGIKAAKSILARARIDPLQVDSVLAGNVAPGDFDWFFVPRHIGLYSGVPPAIPALLVQRICGTGFELFRQAGEQIESGAASLALVVGTESMTRHPIAAFGHRGGFRLGAKVDFRDTMWESLNDPALAISTIQTAENLAQRYSISREATDAFAARSFERALRAQERGWLAGEIVPVQNETFELAGYQPRRLRLSGKTVAADRDTHPRPSPPDVLGKLRPVFSGGVQTSGNSSALTDAAAAALVASGDVARSWGRRPLARLRAVAAVGVPPEVMGIGPAPAIRLLLERSGLTLDDVARFEINEAQGLRSSPCNVSSTSMATGSMCTAGRSLSVTRSLRQGCGSP